MNYEELAFVNQQLAGMLKSGIPLEGALDQLSKNMRHGRFRTELEALRLDLTKGIPLVEALKARKLPEFYIRMLTLGAQTNDLPGVLVLVADYYQRANLVWMRLKGLMIYPAIVVVIALGLSVFLASLVGKLAWETGGGDIFESGPAGYVPGLIARAWVPTFLLLALSGIAAAIILMPACRRALRWRLPGFRENSLTNLAAMVSLMLKSGSNLGAALDMTQSLETGTPAGKEIGNWKRRLSSGKTDFREIAQPSPIFPPLFLWLIAQGGEDLSAGFKRAAEVYYGRALYRIELLLYAALPVSILMLGLLIIAQFLPLMGAVTYVMDTLGSMGG
ncbi:MAG: Type secretion system domain protein [Verrucomicrobiales bacterium]|nr:Type secretion system domain protein [Verrucomicrobiales bacterium]